MPVMEAFMQAINKRVTLF